MVRRHKKEFDDFNKRKVLKIIKKKDMKPGRKLIGNKWVFKKKRDGRYKSRLVALSYMQIPGIEFTDNFAPVVCDVTLRIILVIWLVWKLDVGQLDVKTAFLEGDLKENAEYHAAKEKQGLLNAEMQKINGSLSEGQVIDPKTLPADIVTFGKKVHIQNLKDDTKQEFMETFLK